MYRRLIWILRNLVRISTGRIISRKYKLDNDAVMLLMMLYLALLRYFGIKSATKSYQDPLYALELYVNENSHAKQYYMLRANAIIKKWLQKQTLRGKTVKMLDIGCGIGTSFRYYLQVHPGTGTHGVLCDISVLTLYLCKTRFRDNVNIDLVCCDANYLPFRRASFNIITAYELLEHLKDPIKALKEMFYVLGREQGIMLINYDIDWPDPLHIAPYTRQVFETLLKRICKAEKMLVLKIHIPEAEHNPLYVIFTSH